MLHDQALLDWLADFSPTSFEGIGFRATRRGLDPLVPSTSGGRWMPADTEPVLYTSLERNGAIAEVIQHWSRQNPPPSKPLLVHTLQIKVGRMLSISDQTLKGYGIPWPDPDATSGSRTQAIGAAAAYLGYDSIRVPSARRANDNLILVFTNLDPGDNLKIVGDPESVHWQSWKDETEVGKPIEL